MVLKIVMHRRAGVALVDADLVALRQHGKGGRKDEAKLRAAIAAWGDHGFVNGVGFDFLPIEGEPYNKKMWEARYLRSARSDGTHGYRIFYVITRTSSAEQAVILLRLWAKSGKSTPASALQGPWLLAEEVRLLIEKNRDEYFKDT